MKKLLLALGMVFALSSVAMAQTGQVTWTAPTEGSAVVSYVMEIEIDGVSSPPVEGIIGTSYTIDLSFGSAYRVRVAGVDANNRQGVWSEWSDTWFDDGPPGQPGKPIVVVN